MRIKERGLSRATWEYHRDLTLREYKMKDKYDEDAYNRLEHKPVDYKALRTFWDNAEASHEVYKTSFEEGKVALTEFIKKWRIPKKYEPKHFVKRVKAKYPNMMWEVLRDMGHISLSWEEMKKQHEGVDLVSMAWGMYIPDEGEEDYTFLEFKAMLEERAEKMPMTLARDAYYRHRTNINTLQSMAKDLGVEYD